MEFAELLLTKLLSEDMPSLIKFASESLNLPVMLVDSEYKGVAFYPNQMLDDPIWDEIYKYNRVPPNIVNQLNLDNMMQLGAEDSEPYFLNWGFLSSHPRILMNIFYSGQCIGYLAVLTEECTDAVLKKVKLIGIAAALKMHQDQQVSGTAPDYKTMFLNMLIREKRISQSQLEQWLSYFPNCPQPPCSIIGIADETADENSLNEWKYYLASFFPHILSVIKERNLVLLCENRQLDTIIKFLGAQKETGLRFGISESYWELEDTWKYYEQAMFALSMCNAQTSHPIFYKDVILDYISMLLNKYSCRENFIHPAISKIRQYDNKNRTQYFQTLCAYVCNLFHATDTINRLYIHRNTLPHRLKMIEEIGGIDLQDPTVCTILMLNLYILGFLK